MFDTNMFEWIVKMKPFKGSSWEGNKCSIISTCILLCQVFVMYLSWSLSFLGGTLHWFYGLIGCKDRLLVVQSKYLLFRCFPCLVFLSLEYTEALL